MACTHPARIFPTGRLTENGSPEYFYESHGSFQIPVSTLYKKWPEGNWFRPLTEWAEVPCGKCYMCRQDYANKWAFRVLAESVKYNFGEIWFFTLTYDDSHLPADGRPPKSDLSLFMRKLRRYFNNEVKLRFFGCGEKGGKNGRPHIHVVIFGFDFGRWSNKIKYDSRQWVFPMVEELWDHKGFCPGSAISDPGAAGKYCAKYQLKDYGRDGCWIQGSLKPGIGFDVMSQLVDEMNPGKSLVLGDGRGKVQKIGLPKSLRQKLGLPSRLGDPVRYMKLYHEMVGAGYSQEDAMTFAVIESYREIKEAYLRDKEVFSKL